MHATKDQLRTAGLGSKSCFGAAHRSTFRQRKESRMNTEGSSEPTRDRVVTFGKLAEYTRTREGSYVQVPVRTRDLE